MDRDYYTDQEINEIIDQLEKKNVKIHVWSKKEIENYLIDYNVLYRVFKDIFSKRYKDAEIPLSETEFNDKIESIFEDLKMDVQSQTIARRIINRSDKSIYQSTIISQVLTEFQNNWENREYRRKIIPGKEFFARLNDWLSREYHIAISVGYAINSLRADEISPEVSGVINEFIQLVNSR